MIDYPGETEQNDVDLKHSSHMNTDPALMMTLQPNQIEHQKIELAPQLVAQVKKTETDLPFK